MEMVANRMLFTFLTISIAFLSLKTVLGEETKGEGWYHVWIQDCGAPNGMCKLSCDSFGCYDYTYNYDYYFCCTLESVDYSQVEEEDRSVLDLSGLNLALDDINANALIDNFPKNEIETLIVANNLYYYYTLGNLASFVDQFPNLRNLNISNSTIPLEDKKSYYNELNVSKIWSNHTNLKTLDLSSNHNAWDVNMYSFIGMVSLEHLYMSECCSEISKTDATPLFKDLVGLKSLDISFTEWENLTVTETLLFSNYRLTDLNMTGIGSLPDVSVMFRQQRNLQSVDLSSCEFKAKDLRFESTDIRQLSLRNVAFDYDLPSMKSSFGLPQPSSLKQLDLSGSSVYGSDLGPFPSDLTGLEVLSLKDTSGFLDNYHTYPDFFHSNKKLKMLDLSQLYIHSYDTNLFNHLKNLEILIMENTRIYGNPGTWGHCPFRTLELLDLRGAHCGYDCAIWQLLGSDCDVVEIDMSNSSGFVIDSSKGFNFKSLTTLNLNGAEVEDIYLADLSNLKNMNLFNATIHRMQILGLDSLQTLDFSNTEIIDYLQISKLNNLYFLYFLYSEVNDLEISDLNNLVWLSFGLARIHNFKIYDLDKLGYLDLSNTEITDNLEISTISNLYSLDVSDKTLKYLNISDLNSLESLYLAKTSFENVSLSLLPNLKYLDLYNGYNDNFEFQEVASSLTELKLGLNRLFNAPTELIGNAVNLEYLDLSENYLNELPADLFVNNSKLNRLDLSNNYFHYLNFETFEHMVSSKGSDWRMSLANNIIDCSDCRNKWMSNKAFKENLPDAVCESPQEDYGIYVTDVDICPQELKDIPDVLEVTAN